jgi:hypothetical protein
MLAEAFDEEVKKFYQSAESMPQLQFQVDFLRLYERFIERKYGIYQEEKCQVPVYNVVAKEQRVRDFPIVKEDHQLLALKVLFTEEHMTLFQNKTQCTFSAEHLTRIGIVHVSHDGKPHFIHRTFAEYYVADCLVSRLTKEKIVSEQVETFILKVIFQEEQHRVIRAFIDGLFSRSKIPKEALKHYGNRIKDLRRYDDKILHRAALEGNANIIEFLLDCVQPVDHTDTGNELLLEEDEVGLTAWHIAVLVNNSQVLERLWECAEKKQTSEELKKKLLLGHVTVKKVSQDREAWWERQHPLWSWREKMVLFAARKHNGGLTYRAGTVLHMAAQLGNLKVLQKIREWANEKLTTEEINNKLLLNTDN